MAKAKSPVPEGYHTVTAALVLDDTARAIEWYVRALGAEEVTRATAPDGRIMHAEIRIGDSRIMLNDEMMGSKSARTLGGSPMSLWLFVTDCDALYARAVGAGATGTMPPDDMFWGDRHGQVVDPFGYRWSIATRKEDLTPAETQEREKAWLAKMAASGGKF